MRKLLTLVAVLGMATAPAMAQTTPQPQPAPAEKPKTVTKVVCERVSAEETTGSRLGSAPKRCKKVEVPAPSPTNKEAQKAHPQGHSARAH